MLPKALAFLKMFPPDIHRKNRNVKSDRYLLKIFPPVLACCLDKKECQILAFFVGRSRNTFTGAGAAGKIRVVLRSWQCGAPRDS